MILVKLIGRDKRIIILTLASQPLFTVLSDYIPNMAESVGIHP
jgi:hypothetical protein